MANRPRPANGARRRAVYERVVFPRYNDQDLAAVDFRIADPYGLPNVTDEEPPLDQVLTFVGYYSVDRMIRCVFGHPHKTGFVFRDEAERHYLVGHTCGANVMGAEEWQIVVGQTRDIRDRADYLRQIRALREVLERHRQWLHALSTLPAIIALAQLRSDLRRRRDFYQAARTAVLFGEGRLEGSRKIRDLGAEERREEREEQEIARFKKMSEMDQVRYLRQRAAPKISTSHINTFQVVPLGILAGQTLFDRAEFSREAVSDLVIRLFEALPIETDTVPTSELRRGSRQVRDLLDEIEQIRANVRDAISFFDQDNIERVATWANGRHLDQATYTAAPGALRITNDDIGLDMRIERPPTLLPIEDPVFAEVQEARLAFARGLDVPRR